MLITHFCVFHPLGYTFKHSPRFKHQHGQGHGHHRLQNSRNCWKQEAAETGARRIGETRVVDSRIFDDFGRYEDIYGHRNTHNDADVAAAVAAGEAIPTPGAGEYIGISDWTTELETKWRNQGLSLKSTMNNLRSPSAVRFAAVGIGGGGTFGSTGSIHAGTCDTLSRSRPL